MRKGKGQAIGDEIQSRFLLSLSENILEWGTGSLLRYPGFESLVDAGI